MAKKQPKHGKGHAQLRSRNTRSSRGRLVLSDPTENNQQLTDQLRALGLYAASTVGDGNCLFRALSDQVYGSESRHAYLRADICNWIADHKSRYAPFVEDERGVDVHLRCMRENATYGGHLEISAFAHMTKRNVKVIQPGLVYVIEWDASGGVPSDEEDSRPRRRREERLAFPIDDDVPQTVYIAYHDWEHFSTIRNLRGPHAGLPVVQETQAHQPSPTPEPSKKLPKVKLKLSSASPSPKPKSKAKIASAPPPPANPVEIPLPMSRDPSPGLSSLSSREASSSAQSQATTSPPTSVSDERRQPTPLSLPPSTASSLASPRHNRSPKRSLDESDDTSSSGPAKRKKSALAKSPSPVSSLTSCSDDEDEDLMDAGTPGLSADGSSSTSSSSEVMDEQDDEEDEEHVPSPSPPPQKPLTRRQRKALGLPKPRPALSAGKIIIPGGRYHLRNTQQQQPGATPGESEEWQRNGTGRMDVRGFRELKI